MPSFFQNGINFASLTVGGYTMFDIEKTLLLARTILKLGYVKEAKLLYENLLSIQPNHNLAKQELKLLKHII